MARSERGEFNVTQVSPSRLNSYSACGVAFKMNYIDCLPPQASGSAALFGSVLHLALERWAPDRTSSLEDHVAQAWHDYNLDDQGQPNVIAQFLKAYAKLSDEASAKEQEIRDKWAKMGKESKAPRMTKDWKESAIGRKLALFQSEWQDKLNKYSFYRFSEFDPLAGLYDESFQVARSYEHRMHRYPAPLHTEFHLVEQWRGFTLDCYIDTVEPVFNGDGTLIAIVINDYKTYRKAPTMMKDWRQVVMYYAGVQNLLARVPHVFGLDLTDVEILVGIDYLRWNKSWVRPDDPKDNQRPFPPRMTFKVTDADLDRLESELRMYSAGVGQGIFLPAEKGRNPDYCDYPENCCLRNTSAAGGGIQEVLL